MRLPGPQHKCFYLLFYKCIYYILQFFIKGFLNAHHMYVQLNLLPFLSACPPGFYGIGCAEQCDCANGATCDHVSGACYCTPGWRGMRCDKPCPQGFFGRECQQLCQCDNGADCDHVTGKCRCAAGKSQDVSDRCSKKVTKARCAIHVIWMHIMGTSQHVLVNFRTR